MLYVKHPQPLNKAYTDRRNHFCNVNVAKRLKREAVGAPAGALPLLFRLP